MRMPISKQRNKHIQRGAGRSCEAGAQTVPRAGCGLSRRKSSEETATVPHSPWPGRWWPICSPWNAGNRISCLPKNSQVRRQRKNLPVRNEKTSGLFDAQAARSRSWRLGDGGNSEALLNCFGTGREHKLNLLCGLFGVLDSKWMSGSAGCRDHQPRGNCCVSANPDHIELRALRARPEICAFLLTETYMDVAAARSVSRFIRRRRRRFTLFRAIKRCRSGELSARDRKEGTPGGASA
jgi:hypothetical protein